ncbi:OpgC domain-containing protein [Paracoccus aminophilus]|uniref:OpgC protein n=1 Tax=Paracoccus aminophilus JCM 7686 TaxID=1367847 RepID=S5XPS1_PARAH|nr:OpgC domain-containing protein [Paracoccus aminophilus]AGT09344.1 hypothetical protein JCM7686_2274 [Paracoccus aminophilus JCM 7686]
MKRIASLDMLRGYALVCIMLDHMPVGSLRALTLTNFVTFDAAELFVLLSGFLVGLVWIKVEAREGRAAARKRFWRRAFQVWRALILGAILLALLSRLLFYFKLKHTAVWFEYSNMIIDNPLGYVATVALMWMQPNLLDVLALYVLLIATVPVTVPILLRWPVLFMVASVALWMVAVPLNALIPNQRPGPGLLFNPFGWQLLFFCGVGMGAFRDRITATLKPYAGWVTAAAWGMMLFSMAIVLSWQLGERGKPLHDALFLIHGDIDKWSMDGVRLLGVLAASWLVAMPLARYFNWLADTIGGRALAEIGQGGLLSFVACVLLSIFGDAMHLTAPAGPDGLGFRIVIDIWCILTLWVVAALWMRRKQLWAAWSGHHHPAR